MRTFRFAFVMIAAAALCAPSRPVHAEGSIILGDQYWTQNAPEAKFREFRDVARGPFIEALDLAAWNGRNTYELSAINGVQQDQMWRGMWAWGSKLNVKGTWSQLPHRFTDTGKTFYNELSPGVFVLPDSLQSLNQRNSSTASVTRQLTDAFNNGRVLPIGFQTDVASMRLRARPQQGLMIEANGREITRSGRKPMSAFIGTSPGNPFVELYEPIQQTMIDADVRLNYSRAIYNVQLIGGVSDFNNHYDRMTWDNARRLTDLASGTGAGPAKGQLGLAPDNREIRGSVALGVKLPQKSTFTGTVGLAQITQDQAWIPVTVNASLRPDTIALPGGSTNGKATVLNTDFRLSTMAIDKVRGTLRFHSDKYDNKSEEFYFPTTVNGDVALVTAGEETKPFGNSNWVAGVDLDATPMSKVSVGVTGEYRLRERTHREIDKDKETVIAGRARVRPMDGVTFDAKVRVGNRKLDEFFTEEYQSAPGVWIEQPETRRYDVANRKQTQAQAGLSWSPLERFEVAANYNYVNNDYPDQLFGLLGDKTSVIATEGTVHATSRLDVRGGYGYTQTKGGQASVQGGTGTLDTGASRDTSAWALDITDRNVFVTMGFDFTMIPEKLTITGDYEFSRDFTLFEFTTVGPKLTTPTAGAPSFKGDPGATLYRRHDVRLQANYKLMKSTAVALRYMWEEFDVLDFATKGVAQIAPSAGAFYIGDFWQDYRAHRVALLVKHTF
jgi:MtrB/PioB family decaheme-associated outer membrane protein